MMGSTRSLHLVRTHIVAISPPQRRLTVIASGCPPRYRLGHAQRIVIWGHSAQRVDRRAQHGRPQVRTTGSPPASTAGTALSAREQRYG